ncbi:MAG: hypothetical protein GXO47_06415 [Chlorobi bacterium]|nr:hypothetical protein [Chlorobiota bacterium]
MDTIVIDKGFGGATERKLEQSLNELKNLIKDTYSSLNTLVKINVFVSSENDNEFFELKNEASSIIETLFENNIPAYTIIPEPPLSGNDVIVEAKVLKPGSEIKIERNTFYKHNYVVVSYNEGKHREMYTGGLTVDFTEDFILGCQQVFDFAEQLLMKEDMNFGNVIKQWNYIPHILEVNKNGNTTLQNYQVFNDIRALFYNPELFKNGYPAATDTGTNNGSVIIDLIAVFNNDNSVIAPLNNPVQQNAYEYTDKVLEGEPLSDKTGKKPPLFERGKLIRYPGKNYLYLSGTASIKGEQTVAANDVKTQTEITLNNIKELTGKDNLKKIHIDLNTEPVYDNLIVYLKNKKDFNTVKSIVDKHVKTKNIVYVEAGICRNDLLVEIEAGIILRAQ